jgi:hypothetical protein
MTSLKTVGTNITATLPTLFFVGVYAIAVNGMVDRALAENKPVAPISMLEFRAAPRSDAVALAGAMACQQIARDWLASAYAWQLPTVPVEIVDSFPKPNDQRLAEFYDGKIQWRRDVTDCSIMVHEMVHYHQWLVFEGNCTDHRCWQSREDQAYAVQRVYSAETKD